MSGVQDLSCAPTVGIDPRGPQFSASITAVVLVGVLLLPTFAAVPLCAAQAALFAAGVLRGVQRTPTAWAFREWVRPHLAAPPDLEDPAPPRFAQGVGFGFAAVALIGYLFGATLLGQIAIGLALAAALLNALFRFCLGCEFFLVLERVTGGRAPSAP